MLPRHPEFEPRKPRHQATGNAEVAAEVERFAEGPSELIKAELVNLSRDGFQARVPLPLVDRESIILRLHHQQSGVSLALPGKVCWQRPEDGDTWLLGCLCSQQVDWETLGELFLTGVLATDESAG